MTEQDTLLAQARAAIQAIGRQVSPDIFAQMKAAFAPLQQRSSAQVVVDLAYGPHPRHRLDLHLPEAGGGGRRPVLLFVHGGGFVAGDKSELPDIFYANVGRWAADRGMVGAVMNYRLAPEHPWPAGRDDVAAAVAWLRANLDGHGGDPGRLVVMGHSAGATHVAAFLGLPDSGASVAGAICVSGLYDAESPPVSAAYFGEDASRYAERSPLNGLAQFDGRLLMVLAENDPEPIQRQWLSLMRERLAGKGYLPRFAQARGHNHFSVLLHLNTADPTLGDLLGPFVDEVSGAPNG